MPSNELVLLSLIHISGDSYSISNELLLSALYSIKDDVDAQCRALEEYKRCGEVGLVLFYADRILERIDDKLIETANRLSFPIIVLPGADMGPVSYTHLEILCSIGTAQLRGGYGKEFLSKMFFQASEGED